MSRNSDPSGFQSKPSTKQARKTGADEQRTAAEQHKRFVETARKLGCDEDKDRFEAKLGKIATATRPEPKAVSKRTPKPEPKS